MFFFHIISSLLTKLVRSRWLDIGLVLGQYTRKEEVAYVSKGPRLAQTLFELVTQSSLITGRKDCARDPKKVFEV